MISMKSLVIFMLVQAAVISAKAGLVTFSQGSVNVEASEHVGEGNDLRTGPESRAELLLNPDTYLRIGSEAIITLESESLDKISLRLVKGRAVVDSVRLDRKLPITIRLGAVDVSIAKDGLYVLEQERVFVLDGEMTVLGTDQRLRKGWTLDLSEGAIAPFEVDDLEDDPLLRWSERRARRLSVSPRRPVRSPAGRRSLRLNF
jgi:hypothetical protein